MPDKSKIWCNGLEIVKFDVEFKSFCVEWLEMLFEKNSPIYITKA